jgi:Protein of unknown function (DUF1697)
VSMSQVALFRNLNLGHAGSPTGAELVDAFGGTSLARNFQTNGTVLFDSDAPEATARRALQILRKEGYHHSMVIRPLAELEWVLEEAPSVDPAENVYRVMLSFYDIDTLPAVELPLRSRDQLVELRRLSLRSAGSVCWKPRHTAGDVTGFLEGLLNVPVTTRTVRTLKRLVEAARRLGE